MNPRKKKLKEFLKPLWKLRVQIFVKNNASFNILSYQTSIQQHDISLSVYYIHCLFICVCTFFACTKAEFLFLCLFCQACINLPSPPPLVQSPGVSNPQGAGGRTFLAPPGDKGGGEGTCIMLPCSLAPSFASLPPK